MTDCSISWRVESTETEGAIIFGNDYVDRLYQDEPLAPPDARLDVEDDEETNQQQIQQHALATVVWMCDGHESCGCIFKYIYGKDRRTNSRKESAQTTGLETLY